MHPQRDQEIAITWIRMSAACGSSHFFLDLGTRNWQDQCRIICLRDMSAFNYFSHISDITRVTSDDRTITITLPQDQESSSKALGSSTDACDLPEEDGNAPISWSWTWKTIWFQAVASVFRRRITVSVSHKVVRQADDDVNIEGGDRTKSASELLRQRDDVRVQLPTE